MHSLLWSDWQLSTLPVPSLPVNPVRWLVRTSQSMPFLHKSKQILTYLIIFLTCCFSPAYTVPELGVEVIFTSWHSAHVQASTFFFCSSLIVLPPKVLWNDMKELKKKLFETCDLPLQVIFSYLGCWKALKWYFSTNAWYKNIPDISAFTGTLSCQEKVLLPRFQYCRIYKLRAFT